jgi:hypothetical protein
LAVAVGHKHRLLRRGAGTGSMPQRGAGVATVGRGRRLPRKGVGVATGGGEGEGELLLPWTGADGVVGSTPEYRSRWGEWMASWDPGASELERG